MLEHYFARPRTVDRIRASWIAEPIERYVERLRAVGLAPSTIRSRIPILVRFGEFAAERGARTFEELPESIAAFVEYWPQRHGARRWTPALAGTRRWQVQQPVEELIECAVPEFRRPSRRQRLPMPFVAEAPVFVSRRGQALSRFGLYKIVRRHAAPLDAPPLGRQARRVTPHVLRHTTAVHLLESGVELNVIRAWLGHASLTSTQRYTDIPARLKEAALQLCEAPIEASPPVAPRQQPRWQSDQALLAWLDAL